MGMSITPLSINPRTLSREASLSATPQPLLPPRVQSPPVQQALAPLTTPVTLTARTQTAGHTPDVPFLVITHQMPAALEQSYDLTYGALGMIHV